MNNESEQNTPMSDDVVDVEIYAKEGRKIPPGKHYRIRIDNKKYDVGVSGMTGRQLLELAGKHPPERFRIDQKLHGGQSKLIQLDEYADFTAPGVERFMTLPLDQTDGQTTRREFDLPEEDCEDLEARNLPWEAILEGNGQWVIVYGFPLPAGYTFTDVSVAVLITPGYPTAPLDMAYLYPAIARNDGKAIGALEQHALDGKQWQRWSRHRTGENPWRPGVDTLGGHLRLVSSWLEREFQIR